MIRKILVLSSVVALTQACSNDDEESSQDSIDATSCSVEDDEGKTTIECPDGTSVTVRDGQEGEPGQDGERGAKGAKGAPGDQGKDGRDGEDGEDGRDGEHGQDGAPGERGEPGQDGAPGAQGDAGEKGDPGQDGVPGQDGENGAKGDPGNDGEAGKSCSVECADEKTVRVFCEDGTEVVHSVALCGDPSPATLSVSDAHACHILPGDGRLVCWGSDSRQQLGNGEVAIDQISGTLVDSRKLPEGLATTWQLVSAGGTQTCGITMAGTAYCWGRDPTRTVAAPAPVDMSALPPDATWTLLTTGGGASPTMCGITSGAAGYCWGDGARGQLGDGTMSNSRSSPSAIDVSALPPGVSWSTLSVGDVHVCGITTDGAAYCWGDDGEGRLGNGRLLTSNQPTPTPVDISFLPSGTTWSAISAGGKHTCGVTKAGETYCWGDDSFGQLGRNGVVGPADYPQLVDRTALSEGAAWKRVSAGKEHTCAVATDGAAYCWGNNESNRLGDGTTEERRVRPVAVDESGLEGQTQWVEIQAGTNSSCGLTTNATVYCWGSDDDGRLGNGALNGDQSRPKDVVGASFGILLDSTVVVNALGDETNPDLPMSLVSLKNGGKGLVVTASSSNEAVLPSSHVTVSGSETQRSVSFSPTGRGFSRVTFTVTNADGDRVEFPVDYAVSSIIPDASGRYHGSVSDASTAIDVGDGYMLVGDDETNQLYLHEQTASGPPIKVWDFVDDGTQLRTSELDIEGAARVGDKVVWITSHGNARDGDVKEYRRVVFATTITGRGADVELTFSGRYGGGSGVKDEVAARGMLPELIAWDQGNGHGLGASYLGLFAATRSGVLPNAPHGFNIEGLEFAADGTTGYLALRAPTVDRDGTQHALIIPVVNLLELVDGVGAQSGRAQFGAPILLDLGGRSIRAIRRNDSFQYLISAGPPDNPTSGVNDTWALYTWDGDPDHEPVWNQALPDPDFLTGGTWETIVFAPDVMEEGATFRLVSDSGDTNYYGNGATKDLNTALRKSYSQLFTLQ